MVRTLASQVREFKWVSLITPVCMIVEVLMEMVIPLLMASIVDEGVKQTSSREAMRLTIDAWRAGRNIVYIMPFLR